MTLSDAVRQFIIYIKALRLPQECTDMHLRVLHHILWFYGKNKDLAAFDESTVLQYVKLFDPFDCAQPNQERGEVFCYFTHWMIVNQLIPAWSNQKDYMVELQDVDEHKIPGDCAG